MWEFDRSGRYSHVWGDTILLAFVTTLRHPHNSHDYAGVERLLYESLSSISQQTSDAYRIVIVGNRRPQFELPPRTQFVEVDFDPPSQLAGPCTGLSPVIWDKGTKSGVALAALRKTPPDFVMFFDADDFVHRNVAAHVDENPDSPGWVVKRGYMYSPRRNAYVRRRRLHRICGTSFIIPFGAYQVPECLDVDASQEAIAEAFGYDVLQRALAGHRYQLNWWQDHGRTLQTLPFEGAVYRVETGENHSGNRLLGPCRPYRQHLLDDFAVRSSKPRAATWWSSIGGPAWRPDLRPRRPSFLRAPQPVLHGPGPSGALAGPLGNTP